MQIPVKLKIEVNTSIDRRLVSVKVLASNVWIRKLDGCAYELMSVLIMAILTGVAEMSAV